MQSAQFARGLAQDHRFLMELGRDRAVPALNGEALSLKTIAPEPRSTIEVWPRGFAFASKEVGGARYLITCGLGPCIAVVAHNQEKGLGFIAHADGPENAVAAMEIAKKVGGRMLIYGGDDTYLSSETAAVMEGALVVWPEANVVGRDTLRGWQRYGIEVMRAGVGVDSATGEFFIPSSRLIARDSAVEEMEAHVDDLTRAFNSPLDRLHYDGSRVAPEGAFFGAVRG